MTHPRRPFRPADGPVPLFFALLGALFVLFGCDDSAAPGGEKKPAAVASVSPLEQAEGSGEPNSLLNAFHFEADGLALARPSPEASQLTVAGGCRAPNHLSLGFLRGDLTGNDYFHFSMDSSAPIEPGMTGVIEPVQLTWDNGTFKPDDLPPGVNVKVPARLEGAGRMTITAHSGLGMAGRLAADVEGEVSGESGTARVRVSFDMNLACGR